MRGDLHLHASHSRHDHLVRYPGNLLPKTSRNTNTTNGANAATDDYCAYLSKELKGYQDLTLRLTKQLQAAQTKIDALQ